MQDSNLYPSVQGREMIASDVERTIVANSALVALALLCSVTSRTAAITNCSPALTMGAKLMSIGNSLPSRRDRSTPGLLPSDDCGPAH